MLAQGGDYCTHFNLGSFHIKNSNFMLDLCTNYCILKVPQFFVNAPVLKTVDAKAAPPYFLQCHFNAINNTCAFPNVTSQNVLCEKGLG